MREIKVEGSGWIALWLFCIALNTCDNTIINRKLNDNLDKIVEHLEPANPEPKAGEPERPTGGYRL
jgi:hypothetical protein